MAFDIYGNDLQKGHCEVHPWVHQEYPCSVCLSEHQRKTQPVSQRDYKEEHIEALKNEIEQQAQRIKELEEALMEWLPFILERHGFSKNASGYTIHIIEKYRHLLLKAKPVNS